VYIFGFVILVLFVFKFIWTDILSSTAVTGYTGYPTELVFCCTGYLIMLGFC